MFGLSRASSCRGRRADGAPRHLGVVATTMSGSAVDRIDNGRAAKLHVGGLAGWLGPGSGIEACKVEHRETDGIGDHVDLDNPFAHDSEGEYRERPAARCHDGNWEPIDKNRACERG